MTQPRKISIVIVTITPSVSGRLFERRKRRRQGPRTRSRRSSSTTLRRTARRTRSPLVIPGPPSSGTRRISVRRRQQRRPAPRARIGFRLRLSSQPGHRGRAEFPDGGGHRRGGRRQGGFGAVAPLAPSEERPDQQYRQRHPFSRVRLLPRSGPAAGFLAAAGPSGDRLRLGAGRCTGHRRCVRSGFLMRRFPVPRGPGPGLAPAAGRLEEYFGAGFGRLS